MKNLIKSLLIVLILPLISIGCNRDDDNSPSIKVTSISPGKALAGDHVVVEGQGLDKVIHILISNDESYQSLSFSQTADRIEFNLPLNALAGYKNIVLALPGGERYVIKDYYVIPGAPIISSVSPGSAPVGTPIIVRGSAFVGVKEVKLGNVAIPEGSFTVSEDQSTISFLVPEGVHNGYGYVTVQTENGLASSPSMFFIGKELIIENWDGARFSGLTWTGAYNAFDADKTGILSGPSPSPISGNYYKITSNGTSWGTGTETNALASTFGLTGSAADVLFVADVNTNGSPLGTFLRFSQSNGNFYTYEVTATSGWKTIVIRLNADLGWQYNGNPSSINSANQLNPALLNQIKIQTSAVEGAQINIDNLRFIQL